MIRPKETGSDARDFLISNEFARVSVSLDTHANGMRLRVKSLRTGRETFFDPLQLESLTWLDDSGFRALLDEPFGPSDGKEI